MERDANRKDEGRENHQDSSFSTGNGQGSSYSWSNKDGGGGGGGGGSGGSSSYTYPGPGGGGERAYSGYGNAGNNQFQNPENRWSQNWNQGPGHVPFQNPGLAWSQQRFGGPYVADYAREFCSRNDGFCPGAPNQHPIPEFNSNAAPNNVDSQFSEELPPSSESFVSSEQQKCTARNCDHCNQ